MKPRWGRPWSKFGARSPSIALAGAIVCLWLTPTLGIERNVGAAAPPVFAGHHLTPDTGTPRILYAPSESDDPTYRSVIAEHIGGVCDYFDARFDTPSLALLLTYDCVHTWSNYPYSDPALFGDRLAAYVDLGGKVILGAYATSDAGNSLGGRLVDPLGGYTPVRSLAHNDGMSGWDGMCREDCAWQGIAGLYATHRETVTLIDPANGFICGQYVDGEITIAYVANRRVYYVNGAGGFPVYTDYYMAWVVANACHCAGPPTAVQPSSWGAVKSVYR